MPGVQAESFGNQSLSVELNDTRLLRVCDTDSGKFLRAC